MSRLIIYILAIISFNLYLGSSALAQTIPDFPDTTIDEEDLVDPDAADFSEDIFNDDFTNTSSDTSTSTSTDVDIEETPVETVPLETVEDTQTGPETLIIFWLAFLTSFIVLQMIRNANKRRYLDL